MFRSKGLGPRESNNRNLSVLRHACPRCRRGHGPHLVWRVDVDGGGQDFGLGPFYQDVLTFRLKMPAWSWATSSPTGRCQQAGAVRIFNSRMAFIRTSQASDVCVFMGHIQSGLMSTGAVRILRRGPCRFTTCSHMAQAGSATAVTAPSTSLAAKCT